MEMNLKLLINENPVLRSFLFYLSILSLKMMLMVLLTIRQRVLNNAFISEEDAVYLKGSVSRTNEHVERVRRCHRNDMESIYLFLFVGFAYCWTNPSPFWANILFLSFTVARYVHTFVYTIVVMPQPWRGHSWLAGYLITCYMAFRTLTHFAF